MAILLKKTVYPFAELIRVTSEGTTSIDLMDIPAGGIVEQVLVRIVTAAVGASNLSVGDDDAATGFIVAADATAAAGTVYGDLTAELGAYLKGACGATSGYAPIPKLYASVGKEVKFVLSAAPTTEGVYDVIVMGKRYEV